MWGYQRHFQIAVKHAAAKLFQKLDPDIEVQTFLLGLIREGSDVDWPVCLEPEDCGWTTDVFSTVRADSEHFLAVDGQENLFAMHPSHMASIQNRRRHNANKAAVLKALNCYGNESPLNGHYFSGFVPVGKYDVGVVLILSHRDGISHYKLPKSFEDERMAVPTSLLEAASRIFLQGCMRSLCVSEPENVAEWDGLETDEMLRHAGDRFMYAPVFAGGGVEGLGGLFDACNYIASLNYEGSASSGGMIVAREDHPNLSITLKLLKPVRLSEHRAIRKLLQVSSSGDFLVSDGAHVIGTGKTTGHYDQSKADLLQIRFTGHHKWELLHENHKLMETLYGLPRIPLPSISEASFFSTCEVLFGDINRQDIQALYRLTMEASRQRHGTILVITPSAQDEAIRLASQSTAIEPITISEGILNSVTTIDGAVLLDLKGTCYAIGAILDGDAVPNGSPGRGARYNSSLRYCAKLESQGISCLAVIVSEDGTSELIPALPRKLPRQVLIEKEKQLDELLALAEHPLERARKLLIWLREHRFYLPETICEKANSLVQIHEEVLQKNRLVYIHTGKFSPHPAMSEAFLC